ncbi:hypothetical protein KI387_022699 [Taxus chinensis]|uniref:Uncharacterized protein n=1 Tax=Taxus chinensis TaxID=29808 RepID=A0AA38G0A5_TAXCH|nr:hypothetical protein KI387_022699 [Taxus chinensis]
MGICLSKPDGLDNDHPVSFSEDDKRLCMKVTHNGADLALSDHLNLKEEKTPIDSMDDDLCTSSPSGVCGSDVFYSSHMSSDQVKENAYKVVHVLDKAQPPLQLVTTNLRRISLSPCSKSSAMISSTNSACREVNESPRTKFMRLLLSNLVKSLQRNMRTSSSTSEISISIPDNIESKLKAIQHKRSGCLQETQNIQKPANENHAKSQERACCNDDIYSITSAAKTTKKASLLSNNLKEASKPNSDKLDLSAATFNAFWNSCDRKECQFQTSEKRSYSLSFKADHNAFGSPVSVEGSSNLSKGKKEKRRGRSSLDEWSDSSCDLFDIDFRKPP